MSSGILQLECRVCRRIVKIHEMQQILPCLHIFCNDCINHTKSRGSTPSKMAKEELLAMEKLEKTGTQICPALYCYSTIKQSCYQKLSFGNCDNENCLRKNSFFESTRLPACQHEICNSCLEEAKRKLPQVCPVESCKDSMNEDDSDNCDGPCKQPLSDGKHVILKCCGAYICNPCFEKQFGVQPNPDIDAKCQGPCLLKKPRKSGKEKERDSVPIAKCSGKEDCDHAALNGFPSQKECDHDVCLQCLEKMINDCQVTGSMPMCPNDLCRTPYCIDSVIALKALLPQKSQYFAQLALENQGYDAIKDDSVTLIEYNSDFNPAEQLMVIKVIAEETTANVIYDRKSNVADFIRELRRELKILPLDKVYGYYIRREEDKNDKAEEKKPDEELPINSESLTSPIRELNLTPECMIVVDLSGIVQAKAMKT